MRLSNRTAFTAIVFVLMGTALAHAQKKPSDTLVLAKPQEQLVVLSTAVDRVNQTLTIQGLSFGPEPPQVWCETSLMTVLSATDTQLVVFLPAAVPDGTHLLSVIRGTGEKDRGFFNMSVGTPGQGPAGPTGPAGPAGPAGPKGDTGAAGPKGDTGAAGPKGDTGAAGLKGDTGAAGPQGDVGPMGPKGDTGAAGTPGDTGATGPKGDTGATGATGAPGATGATGPQGPQGAQGAQGPQGLMGPLGPQGLPGVSGYQIVSTALATLTLVGNTTTTMSVTCPVGKRVVSGGYDSQHATGVLLHPVAMFPPTWDTWRVTLRLSQDTAATFQFRVYAICAAS